MAEMLATTPYEQLLAAEQRLLVVKPHHEGLPEPRRRQLCDELTDQALFVLLGRLELLVLDKAATGTLAVAELVETVEQAIARACEDDVQRAAKLARLSTTEAPPIADLPRPRTVEANHALMIEQDGGA